MEKKERKRKRQSFSGGGKGRNFMVCALSVPTGIRLNYVEEEKEGILWFVLRIMLLRIMELFWCFLFVTVVNGPLRPCYINCSSHRFEPE